MIENNTVDIRDVKNERYGFLRGVNGAEKSANAINGVKLRCLSGYLLGVGVGVVEEDFLRAGRYGGEGITGAPFGRPPFPRFEP